MEWEKKNIEKKGSEKFMDSQSTGECTTVICSAGSSEVCNQLCIFQVELYTVITCYWGNMAHCCM